MKPAKIERALKRAEVAAWKEGHEARLKHQKAMETFIREAQEDNAELEAAYQRAMFDIQTEQIRFQIEIAKSMMGFF